MGTEKPGTGDFAFLVFRVRAPENLRRAPRRHVQNYGRAPCACVHAECDRL